MYNLIHSLWGPSLANYSASIYSLIYSYLNLSSASSYGISPSIIYGASIAYSGSSFYVIKSLSTLSPTLLSI